MNYAEYDQEVRGFAETDRTNPIRIGDILNQGEGLFGEKYAQALCYFPDHKQQTISNWKSVCGSVPKEVRPASVRISQMDAVRTLTFDKQKEYLEWAVSINAGRDEIQSRMLAEGLWLPRTVDCAKLVECAIGKLDKALPIANPRMRTAIELAVNALQDGMR